MQHSAAAGRALRRHQCGSTLEAVQAVQQLSNELQQLLQVVLQQPLTTIPLHLRLHGHVLQHNLQVLVQLRMQLLQAGQKQLVECSSRRNTSACIIAADRGAGLHLCLLLAQVSQQACGQHKLHTLQ